jgi:hypothetical protein
MFLLLTSIDTCSPMVYLRPPLMRHSKLLWKRFAWSLLLRRKKLRLLPQRRSAMYALSCSLSGGIETHLHRALQSQEDPHRRRTSRRATRIRTLLGHHRCRPRRQRRRRAHVSTRKTSDSKLASPQLTRRKQLHSSRPTSLDQTDRTSRTNIRPSRKTAREATPSPLSTRHTRRPRPTRRNNGMTRRADSCTQNSNYMRHRVQRNRQA